jgi:hypothetical protein
MSPVLVIAYFRHYLYCDVFHLRFKKKCIPATKYPTLPLLVKDWVRVRYIFILGLNM